MTGMLDPEKLHVEHGAAGTVKITCPRLDAEHVMELRTLVDCHDLYRLAGRAGVVPSATRLAKF